MGAVKKIGDPGGYFDAFSGKDSAEASLRASELQAESAEKAMEELRLSKAEGQGYLQPYEQLGAQGLGQAGFLTDSQAQFDFLQNNPLFKEIQAQNQQVTDDGMRNLMQMSASRGRLSSGDTMSQVNQLGENSARNLLLASTPLIQDQKNSIRNLIGQGLNVGQTQANTALGVGTQMADQQTGIGNALASGQIGSANASATGAQNMAGLAGLAMSFFSDPQLKDNVEHVGTENGYNLYAWDWNKKANSLGLFGSDVGVMADEIKQTNPDATGSKKGYMTVDYSKIGVKH